MKKRHFSLSALLGLSLAFFNLMLFCTFLVYGVWSTNQPPNWGQPFPEGTQIIQRTDTHRGFFRRKGIAVLVVQIPEDYIREFGNRLRAEGFTSGHCSVDWALEELETIDLAKDILESKYTIHNFDDGAIAFIEEPCSDWEVAVYDLVTGLYCCIEYDE